MPARRKSSKGADSLDVMATPTTAEAVAEAEPSPKAAVPAPASAAGGLGSSDAVLGVLVAAIATGMILGWVPGSFTLIIACLLSAAVYLMGTATSDQILRNMTSSFPQSALGALQKVPLTDAPWNMDTVNKFANSCQVREKGLKIVQYILRGAAYSKVFSKDVSAQMKTLSKTTSIARRFFKFCRWVKHFEDLAEAKEEKDLFMRGLLYLRVAANFGADWAEDVCSLERIGVLPKGTLSVEFMLFAEFCQLVLALVECYVTSAKAQQEQKKTLKLEADESASADKVLKQQRKLTMTRLELVKFVSDLGKAIYDCELHFAHEGVFITCSLFSALVSTHKNMFKVLK